ncbi:hypothetical protein Celaphus_00004276, partial [Cervus elaphus hippelaphus]
VRPRCCPARLSSCGPLAPVFSGLILGNATHVRLLPSKTPAWAGSRCLVTLLAMLIVSASSHLNILPTSTPDLSLSSCPRLHQPLTASVLDFCCHQQSRMAYGLAFPERCPDPPVQSADLQQKEGDHAWDPGTLSLGALPGDAGMAPRPPTARHQVSSPSLSRGVFGAVIVLHLSESLSRLFRPLRAS